MRFYSHIDLLAMPEMPEDGAPEASPSRTPVGQIDAQGRVRIQVLPEGKFPHPWYGTLDWSPERMQRMVENFRRGVMGYAPMLNFDHSTVNWNAAEARAAGWFVDLEYAPGRGLYAVIETTNLGADAITNRHYRYISAETCDTYEDSTGNKYPDVLCGAALTNTPFHDTMESLFGHPVEGMACFSRADGPGEPTRSFWVAREEDPEKAPKRREAREFEERLKGALGQGDDAGQPPAARSDDRGNGAPAHRGHRDGATSAWLHPVAVLAAPGRPLGRRQGESASGHLPRHRPGRARGESVRSRDTGGPPLRRPPSRRRRRTG